MDKLKIKDAVAKLRKNDARVIALRNMIELAKAKGTKGDKGIDGINGKDGRDGVDGVAGVDGMNGRNGRNGERGVDGEKGIDGLRGEKGEAGMVWRGSYRQGEQYTIGDVVTVQGSSYICIADTNQAPPIGFGWELMVSRGAQGIRGIKGEDGTGGGGSTDANALTGTTLASNVVTSSLTTVGTLESLTVTDPIVGDLQGNADTATLATTATSATTAGTVTTPAQPTITSVGTLSALTVTATIAGSINGNAATATTATTAGSATTAGTVTTASQPSITSVGTLTGITLGASAVITTSDIKICSTVPAGTGVTPTVQIICPSSAYSLTNGTASQDVFGDPLDTITLQASTSYMFDGQYLLQNGTNTHITAMSFVLGGGASMTNCTWSTWTGSPTSLNVAITGNFNGIFNSVTGGNVNTTTTAGYTVIRFQGIMRVNAGGTVVPQIAFSSAPSGTNQTLVGSYLKFHPIGSNTMDSIGTAIG